MILQMEHVPEDSSFLTSFRPFFRLFSLQMLDLNQLFVKNRIFRAFFSENIWWVR